MNNFDADTQKKIQNMIAMEVQRRTTTFNMPPQPQGGQPVYFYGNQPGGNNMNPYGQSMGPSPVQGNGPPPLPMGNQGASQNNNLNMKMDDAFLPTEDLPIFEVSMQKVERYGGKFK